MADLADPQLVSRIESWLVTRADSTPFHRPAWISAVADGTGQRALMLLAVNRTGAITGLLPLNLIHSPLFGRALVSSGFAVGGGILANDPAVADALADACWTLALSESCPTAELRGGTLPTHGWTLKSETYLNFCKPLETNEDAQFKAVPKSHRAELRKGLAHDLRVVAGGMELLDTHYRLYAENVHRLGTPVFPRALFERVMQTFGPDAEIMAVYADGEPVTTVLSLYHNRTCMPYWHGARLAARKLRSNEVAYFRLMNHARERGCTHFDFGRSKVGTGPAAWKKSWGWDGTPLTYATRAEPGREARDINPLSPQYTCKVELWKRLPLPLANRLGPLIARGLG